MNQPLPVSTGKSLLGAALAGLALVPTSADAAVYIETIDFSNNFDEPTDLTGEFANFLAGHKISGTISNDDPDNFKVLMAPSTLVSLNVQVLLSNGGDYFFISARDSATQSPLGSLELYGGTHGEPLVDVLSFTSPVSGAVSFSVSSEGGTNINYSVASVPEPATGLLGLAGLAAAALQRRRKDT
jgi:uncharacterized protein (TIGR03382 family)